MPVSPQRANVIGLGLIGGSVALGLSAAGWRVTGSDDDATAERAALAAGAIEAIGLDPDASVTFVAVPVAAVVEQVQRALEETSGVVTDVGSAKQRIVTAVTNGRFVGGHPMAGRELGGFDAADADLFSGAVWILTPTSDTDDGALATVTAAVRSLGAEVIGLDPERHDRVVATVSHVPHLAAASLMGVAANRSIEHDALLRIAAGGFRDMTRIASGSPTIWLDICEQNREAILSGLDELIDQLAAVRAVVDQNDRAGLERTLQDARTARSNLPGRVVHPENYAELRIPIPDRSGAAAEIFTLAAELGVNVANFEVVHSAEGGGTAVVTVDAATVERFRVGLTERGYRSAAEALG